MNPLEYIKSDSDNLFKFLFINGVIFLLLNIFYPMQKINEINLSIVECNKNIDLLNLEIEELDKDYNLFKKELINSSDFENRAKYKERVSKKEDFKYKVKQQTKQKIIVENEKQKIKELLNQLERYESYYFWFHWVSIMLMIIGMIGWWSSTIQQIRKTNLEVEKLKKDLIL